MPEQIDIQEILKRIASIEAWASGLHLECQQTRALLEKADVSTAAADNRVGEIAQKARTELRARIIGSLK